MISSTQSFFLILFVVTIFSEQVSAQVTDQRTGISIYFEVHDETFPDSWKTAEINAKGVSLDTGEIERSLMIVQRALDKYPVELIRSNLKTIHILRSIEFFGVEYGGTNSLKNVYIANDGKSMGYTDFYIEKTFHHEFSSVLLWNYRHFFDEEKWTGLNSIPYGDGGVQAIKNSDDSQKFDSSLHEKGFLHLYAISSIENDFNSFAENLFNPSPGFYEAIGKYPELNQKLELIIEFYYTLDHSLTKDYFEKLNK